MSDVNYTKRNWENSPSTNTPISAENLGAMDQGISDCAAAINSNNTDITNLKNNLKANNNDFVFDYDGTDYGYKIGNTFHPFKKPTGTKSITANGTYDVTDYASASVSVPTYGMNTFSALYGGYAGGSVGNPYTTSYDPHAVYIATCLSVGSQGVSTLIYYNGSTRQYNRSKSNKASIAVSRSGNNITFTFGENPDYYLVGFAKP